MRLFDIFKARPVDQSRGEVSAVTDEQQILDSIRTVAAQTGDLMERVSTQEKRLAALRDEIAQSGLNDSQKMICDKGLEESLDIFGGATADATRATKRIMRLRDQVEAGDW